MDDVPTPKFNGTILKPATAVLADAATKLATSRNIAGVLFDGTVDIAVDYFSLNNKPITIIPTTTNLLVSSSYDLLVPNKLGVGTSSTVSSFCVCFIATQT